MGDRQRLAVAVIAVLAAYVIVARTAPLEHTETLIDREWSIGYEESTLCADFSLTATLIVDRPQAAFDVPVIRRTSHAALADLTRSVEIRECDPMQGSGEPGYVGAERTVVAVMILGDSSCEDLDPSQIYSNEAGTTAADCLGRTEALRVTGGAGQSGKRGTGEAEDGVLPREVSTVGDCVTLESSATFVTTLGGGSSHIPIDADLPPLCPSEDDAGEDAP